MLRLADQVEEDSGGRGENPGGSMPARARATVYLIEVPLDR